MLKKAIKLNIVNQNIYLNIIYMLMVICNINCSDKYWLIRESAEKSIRKQIRNFNYNINHIDKSESKQKLYSILYGKALKELNEIEEIFNEIKYLNTNASRSLDANTLKHKKKLVNTIIKSYINYAKSLYIKILEINHKKDKASVKVIYHNESTLLQKKYKINMEKIKKIWKITSIEAIKNKVIKNPKPKGKY